MAAYTRSAEEVVRELKSSKEGGLSAKEAAKRLNQYGKNEFTQKKKKSFLRRFFEQFEDFMILVLIAAALISFAASVFEGNTDFTDPVIILAIVILNAILGVVQEEKAEKSLEALKKISAPTAVVYRDGVRVEIAAGKLVVGDIIEVEAGAYVPADARLLTCVQLKIDESALTGESLPVKKSADKVFAEGTLLAERANMIYSTSIVTNGHALAIVTETGMGTEVGKIADMILNDETPQTPLQKRLAVTGKWLGIAALLICVVIFAMGVVQGRGLFDMFMTSVSLAVAAIPEALPGMVTIMLSLGVQRMAAKNAVVKRLPAVETLGSATWICSDKTGTLTQNEMTVVRVCDGQAVLAPQSERAKKICMAAALCCNVQEQKERGKLVYSGEATELAIVRALTGENISYEKLRSAAPRIKEIPFDSVRKRMTTLHNMAGSTFSVTKGAPDILLARCAYYERDNKVLPITEQVREEIRRQNRLLSGQALRVLAVAYRKDQRQGSLAGAQNGDLEKNLVFYGLLGLMDPPRPEAVKCVKICRGAGIVPVMITGDHVMTACAVARETGILANENEKAVTGAELDAMGEDELAENIRNYRVFARVSPEHKVRIVKALQKSGEIVAMTGDGVNDAPALKAADIGCAMGQGGTDVAKNAADMVLMDDNFATIVEAVREGRGIYDNIRKSIHFLLSCNIGEIITIFAAILCRMPSPLAAVQLLWVNLVTDSLPAIALGVEPPEEGIMKRPPIPPKKGIFADGLVGQIILEGAMIGLLAMTAYLIGGSTYAFAVLSFSQLFHAFNMRSRRSLFQIGFFSNIKMVVAFLVCSFLQAAVLTVPALANIFQVVPLNLAGWGTVLGLSAMPIVLCELQKCLFTEKKK
ncbi:MAG: calcium-translocating P-type ATPase, PMCA-type [Lachnospiraceae bacterium]|nr:calcium-translocating P-type ATPase, PMCA-type [Lachnospiraceae bacterium]